MTAPTLPPRVWEHMTPRQRRDWTARQVPRQRPADEPLFGEPMVYSLATLRVVRMLAERGLTRQDIAKEVGRKPCTISVWLGRWEREDRDDGTLRTRIAHNAGREPVQAGPDGSRGSRKPRPSLSCVHPQVVAMADQGATIADIADRYDRTPATVKQWLSKWERDGHGDALRDRLYANSGLPAPVRANGRILPYHTRTPGGRIDRDQVTQLRAQGLSYAEIGRRLGCGRSAVRRITNTQQGSA